MTRERFDLELARLQDAILVMGEEVSRNLVRAGTALQARDSRASRELIAADQWVNERRVRIGQDALVLIATQQPMAVDMRFVASVMEIAGELERIHDYVKGIGKICLMLEGHPAPDSLLDPLPQMAELVTAMLQDALNAFAGRDAVAAAAIPARDDAVDRLFIQTYRQVYDHVRENPQAIELANRIEWAAHNLERSADRVINICEWIIYLVTGKYAEVESEFEAPPVV